MTYPVLSAGSAAPYFLQRSVRFRGVTGTNFTRVFGTATSTTVYTWSAWVKRGDALTGATNLAIFGVAGNQYFGFNTSNSLILQAGGSSLISTPVYRDPAAWYHIVWSRNGTSNTMYVNGVSVLTGTLSSGINSSGLQHCLGNATSGGATSLFNGYLAEINFVDGQALTPTSFGEFNSLTGVWGPKRYAGTFGNNGFFLPFTNNSSATNLGLDFSGRNNNWTASAGISVTAGTTYDSMLDVPTLTSTTVANYPTLNPLGPGNAGGTYSNANLNFISGVASQWRSAIATQFLTSGKFYFEATIQVLDSYNYLMIGACGIQTNATIYGNYTGLAANGWSVQGNATSGGTKYNNGGGTSVANASFTQFVLNDVLQCAVDVTNGRIWFGKNNVYLEGNPSAGTGASFTGITGPLAPSVSCFSSTAQLAVNFGQRPLTYTPPTGFLALNAYNFSAPSIPNGANQFAATLYTGNDATQTITNNVLNASFQPDFVWIKSRSAATSHVLTDSVRGTTKQLFTNVTDVETTLTDVLTTFNSNGFSLGSDANNIVNNAATTYVGWQWKASNAAAITNVNGTINTSVSANPTAGFSVAIYTGNGANGATVGHGLGVIPAFGIWKVRSGTIGNWVLYHRSLGATQGLSFTTGAAQTSAVFFNNTAPSSSIWTLGTVTDVNRSTSTYVLYSFAQITGYSSFGSYSGNGVVDGPFIYTGFRPAFVLLKNSSATGAWHSMDNKRANPFNAVSGQLYPNSAAAEAVGATLDFTANGFKIRTNSADVNGSTNIIVYAAFAENPFQYALAR
jgi:hypothetical protein